MKIKVEELENIKCPICGKKLSFELPSYLSKGTDVHMFECEGCRVKYTFWGVMIDGVEKLYPEKS